MDNVNHPAHYTDNTKPCECIEVAQYHSFCVGNAIKYVWRYRAKGRPLEDLIDQHRLRPRRVLFENCDVRATPRFKASEQAPDPDGESDVGHRSPVPAVPTRYRDNREPEKYAISDQKPCERCRVQGARKQSHVVVDVRIASELEASAV